MNAFANPEFGSSVQPVPSILTSYETNVLFARFDSRSSVKTLLVPSVSETYILVTGDTTFEVFTSPSNPDLLKVKLLITESTYLDNETDKQGRSGVEKARVRGHCDLLEFVEHERIFADVENIVLVHISDKYSPGYIKRTAQSVVPHSLLSKLHLATFMKETVQ